jgi:hypothetical protein
LCHGRALQRSPLTPDLLFITFNPSNASWEALLYFFLLFIIEAQNVAVFDGTVPKNTASQRRTVYEKSGKGFLFKMKKGIQYHGEIQFFKGKNKQS